MSRFIIILFFIFIVSILFTQQVNAISASSPAYILKVTNEIRAKHHSPALKWDKKLASYAQNWSNKCNFAHSNGPYGENLGLGYASWSNIINDGWYKEAKNYDYAKPGYSKNTGHFTALVWKSTTKIGCGVKACPSGKLYVCSFSSFGNIVSNGNVYFIENVLKP